VRIAQVFPESPAAEAGLARGDTVLEVDGQPVPELLASGSFHSSFGPSEVGITVEIAWRTPAGEERRAVMIKSMVKIPTVSQVEVLELGGRRVGYLHFRNFVRPSPAALDAAFETLLQAGVSDLVLDLRYNGGGLIEVAQHLGALIGGELTEAHVLTRLLHNPANSFRDRDYDFPAPPPAALGLPRIAVIATRASASASELLVMGLRPFIPVALIGDATYGKPVGQYSFDFCEKVLVPVTFRYVNALGAGDFYDGIAPDCAAPDDLDHALGDPGESSLAEALHWLGTGGCSEAAETARAALASRYPAATVPHGWQRLLNAH